MDTKARLQVGIDMSRKKADIALLKPDGKPLVMHRAFSNSARGAEEVKQFLLETAKQYEYTGIDIAVEATGYYWLPFFIQLQADVDLAPYEPRLLVLNAKWVKNYKKSFSPNHKSDRHDPFYIASRMQSLENPSWWKYDPYWLKLRFYTRLRFHFNKGLVREKNHYQLFLFLAHSEYSSKQPFSEQFGEINQKILHSTGLLDQLQELSTEDLAKKLIELTHNRLGDPMKSAERLQAIMQESFTLSPELEPPVQFALDRLKDQVNFYQKQIECTEQEIVQLVKTEYPEVAWLDSIPGIGLVFASGIAAEIGGLARFWEKPHYDKPKGCYRSPRLREIEDAIAKFAGLWWPENSSGDFSAEDVYLSKCGNSYLRYYILQAADHMRRCIPGYAKYYDKKFKEAMKHHHKRALVLTGRKAVALFVGLLHRHEFYQPEEVSIVN